MRNFLVFSMAFLLHGASVNICNAQNLVINEVMSSNQQFLFDSDEDTPDWFELCNSSSSEIQLSDYSVSDRLDPVKAWKFPNYSLGAGKYILLFASGKDRKELPLYWVTIINEGDSWRYIVPTSEPSSAWKSLSFNDSAWKQGSSGFGYGDNDDNTVLDKAMSVFMRKTFTISNVDQVKDAILHIDYDDAFVAYLNGTEIARGNITSSGAPAYNAFANNSNHEARMFSGGLPEEFKINDINSLLVNGTNVLAVQVHNAGTGSSDLTAIPFLSLGFNTPMEGNLLSFIDVPQTKFHTDFNISASGESLYLFKNNVLADSVQIPDLPTNISYGRNQTDPNKWSYFSEPTPEKVNNTTAYTSLASDVTFSVPGGIYTNAFSVKLTSQHAGDKIYYTTNDKEPTTSDKLYTGPISISSTTMLRAAVINATGIPGYVYTQSYFFGIQHDIPIISLVTDPDNFFGYEQGIYVTGPPKPSSGENCDNGANYWQDWERPVHVRMIMPDGKLAFEQNGGVKIFGGCSRGNAQKSLSLRFRKSYGKEGLNYKVFDDLDIDIFYALNLRSSGNDWNGTMFRDGLQTHLFPESMDKTAFRPSVVYINGEYWGIHNIRERIDQDYIATHHNLDPSSINLMEFHVNWLVNLIEGEDQNYLDMLDYIEKNDLTEQANYEYIKTQMDVENFALYEAANICVKNTDWPGNNVKYWQSYDGDGKWRWITFDLDFGFTDVNHNTLTFALADNNAGWPNPAESTFLLRMLNKNTEFRNLFINAFADELNTLWITSDVNAIIDKMKGDIATEIPRHFSRWGANANAWSNNVNSFYSFVAQRPAAVRKFVQNYYGLSGTYSLTLNVSDAAHGNIKLNTIMPKVFPWSGLYFKDIPVELTAIPKRGYKFVRWEGSVPSTDAKIVLKRNQTSSAKAIFEKDETLTDVIVINEVFYTNVQGDSPQDWVELYNQSNSTLDLSRWSLKDSENNHQFDFPTGTVINANDYLAVCRDEATFIAYYGLNLNTIGNLDFRFSNSTDCVRLYDDQNLLIDSLGYTSTNTDSTLVYSYQRIVEGNEIKWYETNGFGTPLAENNKGTSSKWFSHNFASASDVVIYPNPFSNNLNISFQLAKPGTVSMTLFTQNGTMIKQMKRATFAPGEQHFEWNEGDQLQQGIYVLVIQTADYVTSKKIIKL